MRDEIKILSWRPLVLTQLDGCIFRLALKNKVPQCIHLKMSQGVLQWRKLEHVQRPLYQSGNPISGTNSERQVMDDDPSSRTRMREVVCDVVRKQSLHTTHVGRRRSLRSRKTWMKGSEKRNKEALGEGREDLDGKCTSVWVPAKPPAFLQLQTLRVFPYRVCLTG